VLESRWKHTLWLLFLGALLQLLKVALLYPAQPTACLLLCSHNDWKPPLALQLQRQLLLKQRSAGSAAAAPLKLCCHISACLERSRTSYNEAT
jgi:hypothetical protein